MNNQFAIVFLIISAVLLIWIIGITYYKATRTAIMRGIVFSCAIFVASWLIFLNQTSREMQHFDPLAGPPTEKPIISTLTSTGTITHATTSLKSSILSADSTPITPAEVSSASILGAGEVNIIVIPDTQIEIPFVYVPEGQFTMGSTPQQIDYAYRECSLGMSTCQRMWFEVEAEPHQIQVGAFLIMQTEVTNIQYHQFVDANGYDSNIYWNDEGLSWRNANHISGPDCLGEDQINGDSQPAVCISWWEATAFANWLSNRTGLVIRLPTEAEWEKAARGTDGRSFPWGERWKDNYANKAGSSDGFPFTAPVGSFPYGTSPYNAFDMTGNVWEWTNTVYLPYPYKNDSSREINNSLEPRSNRGGSWANSIDSVRTTVRGSNYPQIRSIHLGFRLVWIPEH